MKELQIFKGNNNSYDVRDIETVEECDRALEIENKRKEEFESKGITLVEDKEEVIETIPSYEVAKMMEREHAKVLKMLEGETDKNGKIKVVGIIPVLVNDASSRLVDYFIKSEYKDAKGEKRKCYECTKMGCELLANKMTGEKGILFSARYVKAFNQMKNQLKQNLPSYAVDNPIERAYQWAREQECEQYKQCLLRIEALEEKRTNLQLLHSGKTYAVTEIAKELGMTARELNKELHDEGIQYKVGNTWVLYSEYDDKGYTSQRQSILDNDKVIYYTKWTEEGRRFILDLFKNK